MYGPWVAPGVLRRGEQAEREHEQQQADQEYARQQEQSEQQGLEYQLTRKVDQMDRVRRKRRTKGSANGMPVDQKKGSLRYPIRATRRGPRARKRIGRGHRS